MPLNFASYNDIRLRAYLSAMSVTQDFLDQTFGGQDTQLEAVCEVTKDATVFRFSNRPKFIGDTYYQGRAVLPKVSRTLGEFLAPEIKFADARVDVSNVDGAFNRYLPGGADFQSFIGAQLALKFGIRDVAASYITFFLGDVKEDQGVVRAKQTLTFNARDRFERLNAGLNLPTISAATWDPTNAGTLPTESLGKCIPFVLGDWSVGCNFELSATAQVNDGSPTPADVNVYVPKNFYGGALGLPVVTLGGGSTFVVSIGNGTNVLRVPTILGDCFVKRGEVAYKVSGTPAVTVTAGFYTIDVSELEGPGGPINYFFQSNDVLIAPLKVPYASGQFDNLILQAQDVFATFLGLSSGDYDSTWATFAAKNTPAQSAIALIKSRVWLGKNDGTVLDLVLTMLEQVRLEAFTKVDGKLSLSSLHFEDWPAPSASFAVKQFDIQEDTFSIESDARTFFNSAQGTYGYTPAVDKTNLFGTQFTNADSVTKSGKFSAKSISFPNLYVQADVDNQVKEIVRLFSAGLDFVKVTTSWRFLLRELGEFVQLDLDLGGISFAQAPAQIRDLELDFDTGAVTFRLLSLQAFGYPAYTPPFTGTLSSSSQTLT